MKNINNIAVALDAFGQFAHLLSDPVIAITFVATAAMLIVAYVATKRR